VIEERGYDGEFDDVKTDVGHREVAFDELGVIQHALERCRKMATFLTPDDLVFANRAGNPIDRHNLFNRQVKPTALALGPPKEIDFRSFWTMHSSLMLRTGRARSSRETTWDMRRSTLHKTLIAGAGGKSGWRR
jgi:hypothetical protein